MRTVFLLTVVLSFFAIASESNAQIEVLKGRLRSNLFSPTTNVPEGKLLEIVDFFTSEPRNQQAGNPGLVAVLELIRSESPEKFDPDVVASLERIMSRGGLPKPVQAKIEEAQESPAAAWRIT